MRPLPRMRNQPRMTVEECSRLSITDLRRAGLFRGSLGTWGSSRWSDANGIKIRAVVFRLLNDCTGGFILQVREDVGIALPTQQNLSEQTIPITATTCRFGGQRFWFCCPKATNGTPCGRRVTSLYSLPGNKVFGCRLCLNLTYSSVQQHDSRVDKIVRLSYEQIMGILMSGSPTERSLASRAVSLIRRKYEGKLAKYGRRQRRTA
jgi:hypothetical protein